MFLLVNYTIKSSSTLTWALVSLLLEPCLETLLRATRHGSSSARGLLGTSMSSAKAKESSECLYPPLGHANLDHGVHGSIYIATYSNLINGSVLLWSPPSSYLCMTLLPPQFTRMEPKESRYLLALQRTHTNHHLWWYQQTIRFGNRGGGWRSIMSNDETCNSRDCSKSLRNCTNNCRSIIHPVSRQATLTRNHNLYQHR